MILPLADIVDVAVRLADLSRDISLIEAHVDLAEEQYPTASVLDLPRIYGTVGHQTAMADIAYQGSLIVGGMIRGAVGADGEAAEMVKHLRSDYDRLVGRVLSTRSKLREMHGPLGDAAVRLRDQSLDERLMRILPPDGDFDLSWIEEEIRRDHAQVAEAIAAWRTMNDPHPILYVVGSSSRDEIRSALNRLTSAGRLALRRSIYGVRWERRRAVAVAA